MPHYRAKNPCQHGPSTRPGIIPNSAQCRYHHRRLHEGGEILHRTPDGDLYLITPTGTRPAGHRRTSPRAP
jgi:hypothetical protein